MNDTDRATVAATRWRLDLISADASRALIHVHVHSDGSDQNSLVGELYLTPAEYANLQDRLAEPVARFMPASAVSGYLRGAHSDECSCGTPGTGDFDGPHRDCSIHGEVPTGTAGLEPRRDVALINVARVSPVTGRIEPAPCDRCGGMITYVGSGWVHRTGLFMCDALDVTEGPEIVAADGSVA